MDTQRVSASCCGRCDMENVSITHCVKCVVPGGKGVGMLVISLRGVNFEFWSHLGCSGQNAIIFSREGLSHGCTPKKYKYIYIVCVLAWSLLGVKKLAPLPDRSPLGVEYKISDEYPHPFHMRSPPYAEFTLGMHSLIEPYVRTLETRLTCR